jgi:hypothetical protein
MIRSIAAGLALGALCIAYQPANARWYISHAGAEACVPIDNIDPTTATRLYYGAGEMHTPDDFVSAMRSRGLQITEKEASIPSTHVYVANSTRSTNQSIFVLFGDKDICQAAMAMLEK